MATNSVKNSHITQCSVELGLTLQVGSCLSHGKRHTAPLSKHHKIDSVLKKKVKQIQRKGQKSCANNSPQVSKTGIAFKTCCNQNQNQSHALTFQKSLRHTSALWKSSSQSLMSFLGSSKPLVLSTQDVFQCQAMQWLHPPQSFNTCPQLCVPSCSFPRLEHKQCNRSTHAVHTSTLHTNVKSGICQSVLCTCFACCNQITDCFKKKKAWTNHQAFAHAWPKSDHSSC